MKTNNDITYTRAILYGIIAELILVLVQFVYLKNYVDNHSDADFTFTSEYMMSQGFYVFQIIGFIFYTVIVFTLIRNIKTNLFYKILALIIAGSVVELTFYGIVPADYQMAYFYSILDKFIAGTFGTIVYYYTSPSK